MAVLVSCQPGNERQALVLGSDKLTLCRTAEHVRARSHDHHMIITWASHDHLIVNDVNQSSYIYIHIY